MRSSSFFIFLLTISISDVSKIPETHIFFNSLPMHINFVFNNPTSMQFQCWNNSCTSTQQRRQYRFLVQGTSTRGTNTLCEMFLDADFIVFSLIVTCVDIFAFLLLFILPYFLSSVL